ncbi:MAG: hypothetical protein AVDCRST_MAG10-373, partial [uncultured Acidimicrobiales bacterium]
WQNRNSPNCTEVARGRPTPPAPRPRPRSVGPEAPRARPGRSPRTTSPVTVPSTSRTSRRARRPPPPPA